MSGLKRKTKGARLSEVATRRTPTVAVKDSLAFRCPDIARQWAKDLNGALTPNDVSAGSGKTVWWRCKRNREHVWSATIYNRTKENGTGCPFCSHRKAWKSSNLVARYPQVALEWHPRKNRPLTPYEVVPGSQLMIWWQCVADTDHVWQASVYHRARRGHGCPYCSGQRVSKTNSLAAVHPQLAREWHPSKNGSLRPTDVTHGSVKRVWWRCRLAGHEWEAAVLDRSRGNGCPYCSHHKVSSANSLAALQPGLAQEFHPKLNGDDTPDTIAAQSNKVVWWQCPQDRRHVWQCRVSSRTNSWQECPHCKGASPLATSRAVSRTNSIGARYPEIAKQFDLEKNAPYTPFDFACGSEKKVWWRCPEGPDHSWQAVPVNVVKSKTGGCPFCGGKKASITNSLVSQRPDLALEWDHKRNRDININEVTIGSHRVVSWKCANGHEWTAQVRERVRGYGFCRQCR